MATQSQPVSSNQQSGPPISSVPHGYAMQTQSGQASQQSGQQSNAEQKYDRPNYQIRDFLIRDYCVRHCVCA